MLNFFIKRWLYAQLFYKKRWLYAQLFYKNVGFTNL
jgi:hypothetical protein